MYSRTIDNEVLTLSASGWTYRNTFVLYDYETESIWYHLAGTNGLTCISGTHANRFLPEMDSYFIRWDAWLEDHPGSQVLRDD